jgi:hypothetical protein
VQQRDGYDAGRSEGCGKRRRLHLQMLHFAQGVPGVVDVGICQKCGFGDPKEAADLVQESHELIAIITAIIRNRRARVKVRIKKVVRAVLVFLVLNALILSS